MTVAENSLRELAKFQNKNYVLIFLAALLFTSLMVVGLTKVRMQTGIMKEMPQDLPVFKLKERVADKFGSADTSLVVVQIDPSSDLKERPIDIRDPKVLEYLLATENQLKRESMIDEVQSIGSMLPYVPDTLDDSKLLLSKIPGSDMFFNRDYTATLLYVYSTIGTDEEKVRKLTALIEADVHHASMPPGIKVSATGEPQIKSAIFNILKQDALYTISIASALILVMLIIVKRSFTRGILVFVPIFLGLVWTLGTMGWLGLPLSVATVGIGAMILGLGVEYGIFLVARYSEEREKKSADKAIEAAVSSVGSAIFGSGTTTIIGFLSLMIAAMPMLQHLGFTLALGIFYCLSSAVVVNPSFILLLEKVRKSD